MNEPNRIGRWIFDAREPVLRCGDEERRLEDRAARTLELLCRRRGDVVSKAELITAVWDGRSVSANSVAIVIGDLRRALEDDARAPVHIVTVNKRGHRLASDDAQASRPGTASRWRGRAAAAFGGLAIVGALGFVAALVKPAVPAVDLVAEATRNDTGDPGLEPLTRSLQAVVVDSATHLQGVRVLSGAESEANTPRRFVLRSRLIMWNGAPELALSAVDAKTRVTVWSAFARGPSGELAKSTAASIGSLGGVLAKAP